MSPADGDIIVSLNPDHDQAVVLIRQPGNRFGPHFPSVSYWYPPADIVAQILNFGLPAPFDVQIVGADKTHNAAIANRLADQIKRIPGAVDVRVQEPQDTPRLNVTIDLTRAGLLGITENQSATSVLVALAGSNQVAPNYWVDPKNGVSYQLNAQTPQYDINSLNALLTVPIVGTAGLPPQILGNIAQISRGTTAPIEDHFDIRPVINVYGNVDGRDLGSVSSEVTKLVNQTRGTLPRRSSIVLRGQRLTINDSFTGLYLGLAFSMVLVYLLMVVNF